MSTRGCIGVIKEGAWYGIYNHWDSYPTGLGIKIQEKLIKEVQKGKTLDQICNEILQYTGWEEYCNNGICPYCGQQGDPYSISGHIMLTLDELKSRKERTKNEEEVYQNLRTSGYPDPYRKWHEHTRELIEPPSRYQITEKNVGSYNIDYIYLIDPINKTLTITSVHSPNEVVIPINDLLERKVNWSIVEIKLTRRRDKK